MNTRIQKSDSGRQRLDALRAFALLALLFACFPTKAAARQCQNELRRRGNVTAVDLGLAQLTVHSNLVGGIDEIFQTDAVTEFKGSVDFLFEIQLGDAVDIDYCPGTNPAYAVRVDVSPPIVPPAGALVVDLDVPFGSESVPVQRIYGDDTGDTLNHTAFGDYNGDGYSDLLVLAGRPGVAFSDALTILFGGAQVPGGVINLDTDGVVSANGETRLQPTIAFQAIGNSFAAGDFDGDGFDDVFVAETGAVHIVYGRKTLPNSIVSLDPTTPSANETLLLDMGRGYLATGDINGDGFADVVGDRGSDGVFVAYGGPNLRGQTRNYAGPGPSAQGETRILIELHGSVPSVRSLASGDINGDGFDDVIIGVSRLYSPGASLPNMYVVYGGSQLPSSIVDLSLAPTSGLPRTRTLGLSVEVVATGDMNGDGFDDVALGSAGVPGPGDNFSVGEAYVLYGGASLPGTDVDVRGPITSGVTRISALEEFGGFASALALGDVTGDGLDDLVMGAKGSVPFGTLPETNNLDNGTVYVIHGSPALVGQDLFDVREFSDEYLFADDDNDHFGSFVAAGGDMNRDGVAELAASAEYGNNPGIGGDNSSGYAAVKFHAEQAFPATATVTRASRAGDGPGGDPVPPTDFGSVGRATVDYSDEDTANASATVVTLHRSGAGLPLMAPADAYWSISTNRTNWASAMLTLHYTDQEIEGLDEHRLAIFSAPSPSGPFTRVPSHTNRKRNTIRAKVTGMGVFAIGEVTRVRLGSVPNLPPQ